MIGPVLGFHVCWGLACVTYCQGSDCQAVEGFKKSSAFLRFSAELAIIG